MKKVLSLVLAAAMATAMGVSTFAAETWKAKEMKDNLTLGYSGATSVGSIAYGDINPMDEVVLKFNLKEAMFVADKDKGPFVGNKGNLSSAEIRASKIDVRSQIKGGSKVIKDIKLNTKDGRVEVKFVTEFVSTKEQDVEVFVYLTIDGKRQDDYGVTITGTVENTEVSVYKDYDYVDLAKGYVAVAEEFVPKIEVDLGNGVSIFTKLFKDKKYYGTATRDADQADDVVFAKYPDIDNVVTLKTVGLNSTGDIVKLATDYSDYYVYDKDMNYLGQSKEMLPYSTKYYLANKKLDVASASEEPSEVTEPATEEPVAISNPASGGDETVPNINANPGTGR